jgi:hypothetical protein
MPVEIRNADNSAPMTYYRPVSWQVKTVALVYEIQETSILFMVVLIDLLKEEVWNENQEDVGYYHCNFLCACPVAGWRMCHGEQRTT